MPTSNDGSAISVSTTTYATGAQLLERYDARVLGDLVADDNTQVAAAALPANSIIVAALEDASGDIEAALFVGRRYSPADLSGLTGNSQKHLIRITCDIAVSYLLRRRVEQNPERAAAQAQLAESHLEMLRDGVNVFGLDPQMDAGKPTTTGPSTPDFTNLNLIRDRTRNYYPAKHLPGNR